MFVLDQALANDSVLVLPLLKFSQVRLMNDARYPWLLLVPKLEGAVDLHDLSPAESATLIDEARLCSQTLARLFDITKTNVATLGNMVRQMHIHIIGRRSDDPAWPSPVWGVGAAVAYDDASRNARVSSIAKALRLD